MEIRRFGVGHRRPDGPEGTEGVSGQVIHSDARGVVSELAFARHATVEPHTNPNTTWFVVIEGGGFVQVGEERTRVAAGEAVLWPANVVHGASTDLSEMRAVVVEFPGPDDAAVRGIVEGGGLLLGSGLGDETARAAAAARVTPGEGRLAPKTDPDAAAYDPSSGEPL